MSGKLARRIAAFELLCQRRRDLTSTELGRLCLQILKECAKQSRPEDIEAQIHQVCDRLEESVPWAIVIKNFCTRVIQMLNEEMNSAISTASPDTVHRSKSLLELFASANVTFDLSAPQLPLLDECIIRIDEVISPQSVQVAEGRLKCVIPAPFFFFQMGKTFCPVIDAVTVLHRFP